MYLSGYRRRVLRALNEQRRRGMFYKIAASVNDIERIYSVRDNCILYEAAVEVAGKSEEFFCSCGQSCYLFAVKKRSVN